MRYWKRARDRRSRLPSRCSRGSSARCSRRACRWPSRWARSSSRSRSRASSACSPTSRRRSTRARRSATRMARHRKVFQELYVNMVRAGEASGNLDAVHVPPRRLPRGAEQAARQGHLGALLSHRMIVIGAGIMGILMVSVVPKVTLDLRRHRQGAAVEHAAAHRHLRHRVELEGALVLSAIVIGGVIVFRRWKNTPRGRAVVDRIVLKLPVVGPLARKVAITRFAKTLSTMLASGVPLLRALDIVKSILGNTVLQKVVEDAKGVDPGGRVDRRAAQALGRVSADRDAHGRGRRALRPARADARERGAAPTSSRSI